MEAQETIDRLTDERNREHAAHCETIRLLGRVAAGDVRPEWVKVDLNAMSWSFAVPQPVETEAAK